MTNKRRMKNIWSLEKKAASELHELQVLLKPGIILEISALLG